MQKEARACARTHTFLCAQHFVMRAVSHPIRVQVWPLLAFGNAAGERRWSGGGR